MSLVQIIYTSQPFGYDDAILSGILMDARRCNKRDGLTGALVCRHDIFLQLLEGPAEMIDAAYARIARDDRHVNVSLLVSREVEDRMFTDWAMLHDPAKTWVWSVEQIDTGILDRVTPDEIVDVFGTLAAKVAA